MFTLLWLDLVKMREGRQRSGKIGDDESAHADYDF
jgi:hypothetical protein